MTTEYESVSSTINNFFQNFSNPRQNEYQLSGRVIIIIINGDGGCGLQQPTGTITARASWLGLRAVETNRVSFCNGYSHDDLTKNIKIATIIIIILNMPIAGTNEGTTQQNNNDSNNNNDISANTLGKPVVSSQN